MSSLLRVVASLQLTVCVLVFSAGSGTVSANQQADPVTADAAQLFRSVRRLPLNGTVNTRDLGGYRTADQRRVRWGQLFRSDRLSELSDADLVKVEALGLAVVTDFRSLGERDAHPNRLPQQSPAIEQRLYPMSDPAVNVVALGRRVYSGQLTDAELVALLDRTGLITNDFFRQRWGQWIRSLAEPGNLPQLFHCTAGKDRTGMAAVLLLLTLGVPKEQVMADFLLTNQYLALRVQKSIEAIQEHSPTEINVPLMSEVLGVSKTSLEEVFAHIDSQYGSVDAFIEQGLGIDAATRAQLQSLLLE